MTRKIMNGLDLQGQRIQNAADGSSATDLVTLQQMQAFVRGLSVKTAVRAASTANITVSAPGASIDGVTLATNDRVLLKNQSSAAENGLWSFNGSAAALTRTSDGTTGQLVAGSVVYVTEGTANGDKAYALTTDGTITVGTTAQAWTQFGGGTSYTAGNGLTGTTTFAVLADTGILVTGTGVAVDFSVAVKKFAANVGDGTSTSVTVTHNLATRDVVVTLFDASTFAEVEADVVHTTTNTVTLTFATAPASNAYRCVVHG